MTARFFSPSTVTYFEMKSFCSYSVEMPRRKARGLAGYAQLATDGSKTGSNAPKKTTTESGSDSYPSIHDHYAHNAQQEGHIKGGKKKSTAAKVYTGPRGGKYVIRNGKKVYI